MEVFKLFATLGLNMTDFEKGLNTAQQRLDGVEQSFTSAGRSLSLGLTAPIVGIGTAALKASIDFESAFAGVRKTVDATEAQFAMLEQGILDMSERLPASASEIARVAEAAGQLGIQADDVLEFTEVMIGLGEATADMLPEEAAMQVARFMNIMQTAPSDVDRLASTIVDLGNNLAATEGEIALMGMRLAGAGNLIGLTEAEVLGLAGSMTSLGIRAEAGGTAMSRVMREIMNAVMAGGDDLETFAGIAGVAAEEFAAAFSGNPIQAIQLFSDGLGRIRDEGGNVNEALEAVSLNDIRVSDALLRMSGAGDMLATSIELATNAWSENTALQEEVGRRYETTESQLRMLWNQLSKVAITLGEVLVPFLMDVVEAAKPLITALQGLVEWFGNLDPRMQQAIVSVLGVTAALGPVLYLVGSFAGAISNLLPILALARRAFVAIRVAAAVLTGPIGWVTAAVGALVWAFSTDFLGIRTKVIEAWDALKDAFERGREVVTNAAHAIADAVTKAWDAVKAAFSAAVDHVMIVFDGIKRHFELFIEFIKAIFRGDWAAALDIGREMIENWWNTINDFLFGLPAKMLQFGKDLIGGLVNGVKSMMDSAVNAVKGVGDGIINGFKGMLGIQSPSKVFHEFGENIGDGLADGIEASTPRVVAAVEAMGASLITAGRAIVQGADWTGANIAGALTTGLEGRDAIRALEDRLDAIQARRDNLITADPTARRVGNMFADLEAKAIEDELRKLREELVRSRVATARETDVQTRRFAMAVTTFGNDVRAYTLSSQRY